MKNFNLIKRANTFLQEIYKQNIKRYPLDDIYLTRRETECMVFLVEGQTAKEIAKHLNISPKTVEDHIGNVKIKLDCYTKSQLISILLQNNFPNCLFDA